MSLTLTNLPGTGATAGLDDAALAEAHRKAKEFIEQEQQFHLGCCPPNSRIPKPEAWRRPSQRDLPAAVRMLQSVDEGILAQGETGPRRAGIPADGRRHAPALEGQGHICFSGCGATGRLAILLEAAWREFWQDFRRQHPDIAAKLPDLEDRVTSIMTGGDFALIRSVESFEDQIPFGRQAGAERTGCTRATSWRRLPKAARPPR